MTSHRLFSGFDFFGAGNVGDDLTFAGFLRGIQEIGDFGVSALTAWDITSQRTRFPAVSWREAGHAASWSGSPVVWAGVGDTPLQLTSGRWFLDQMLGRLPEIRLASRRVLIGIGAEREIEPCASEFASVLKEFDAISTRDAHSADVIVEMLGYPPTHLFVGADLANISLPDLVKPAVAEPQFEVGLIVGGELVTDAEIREIRSFSAKHRKLAYLATETRDEPHFERGVYGRLTRFPWSLLHRRPLFAPPYHDGDLRSLIAPITRCRTVISSRYHGLLASAWSGCRVAAIGRSSKVIALARELGVPCARPPLTTAKLEDLAHVAVAVPREILSTLRTRAIDSVRFCFDPDSVASGVNSHTEAADHANGIHLE